MKSIYDFMRGFAMPVNECGGYSGGGCGGGGYYSSGCGGGGFGGCGGGYTSYPSCGGTRHQGCGGVWEEDDDYTPKKKRAPKRLPSNQLMLRCANWLMKKAKITSQVTDVEYEAENYNKCIITLIVTNPNAIVLAAKALAKFGPAESEEIHDMFSNDEIAVWVNFQVRVPSL